MLCWVININAVDAGVLKLLTGEISFSLHYPQLKSLPTWFLIIADNSSKQNDYIIYISLKQILPKPYFHHWCLFLCFTAMNSEYNQF